MWKFGFGVVFLVISATESYQDDYNSSYDESISDYDDTDYTSSCFNPPLCPQNEEYSNCSNGLCQLRYCTQYGDPLPFCPKFNMSNCKSGCLCKKNYLRNPQGDCVPQDECPKYLCTGNEVYSKCTNGGCEARNCSQLGEPVPCVKLDPANFIKGCVCVKDYLRASNGSCVPSNQCPKQDSSKPCKPGDMPVISGTCPVDAQQRLLDGNTMLTGNFLSVAVRTNIGKSVVMSPFSVIMPLAELALFTEKGESYNQLMNLLNLKTKEEIRCVFPDLINSYKLQKQSELALAAKVYVSKQEQITSRFQRETELVFESEAESVDFSKSEEAANTINEWVEQQTRNRIKDLVAPSMFNRYTRIVLTNAIYFLGSWVNQFDPKKTTSSYFHVSENEKIEKDFMFQKGTFRYADIPSIDAKVLKMPYKGFNFTYVAFLPNAIDGYVDLVEKLRDPTVLHEALNQLKPGRVAVSIPRYEIATSLDLSNILQQLNVSDIFDASKSDLEGIIESKEKLQVSAALQKAYIKVDEVGTEAAAANAFIVGATAVQQIQSFNADHAFVYYIFLNDTPLFCGVVAN